MGKKKVKRIGKRQLDSVKKSRKLIYIGCVVVILLVVFVSVYFSTQDRVVSDYNNNQGRAVSNPCDTDTCSQHSNAGSCHCHGRCDTAGCRCHHGH